MAMLFYGMSTIELICLICNRSYHKSKSEYNRNKRKGRPSYCSLACAGKKNVKNIPAEKAKRGIENLCANNRKDIFSPFRWHLRNIKRRGKECNVELQDLKDQWEKQKGICPFTGWELKNMPNTSYATQLPLTPDRASLDRIDGDKGYVKGNIQFVSAIAQFAKHKWSDEVVIDFCEAVSQNRFL